MQPEFATSYSQKPPTLPYPDQVHSSLHLHIHSLSKYCHNIIFSHKLRAHKRYLSLMFPSENAECVSSVRAKRSAHLIRLDSITVMTMGQSYKF